VSATRPVRPITPAEVAACRIEPEEVFAGFNAMIVKHWDGHSASFTQKAVTAAILKLLPGTTEQQLLDNHWLDVEPLYVKAGWRVKFDNPGYNESYEARFVFTSKRKKS
jgi:hypothetical protein